MELTKSGVSWYAASRTDLTIGCRAKMEFVSLLQRWKSQLGCESSAAYRGLLLTISDSGCSRYDCLVTVNCPQAKGGKVQG